MSAMQQTSTLALPGLDMIGKRTVADLPQAVVVKRTVEGDAWRAIEHLPEGITADVIRSDVRGLVYVDVGKHIYRPEFDQLAFINLIRDREVGQTPAVDMMLANSIARDSGEAGSRVVNIVNRCRDTKKRVPVPPAKFMEKYRAGHAKAGEILDIVKWLTKEIKKAIDSYKSLLTLLDAEKQYHLGQAQKSIEAVSIALTIKDDEEEREDKLTVVAAILEELQALLGAVLKGDLKPDDRTRLNMVSVLAVARLKNMRPLIQDANAAVLQFAYQANSNALTAMDQMDFAEAGLATYRRNIAAEIMSRTNISMNMAYLEGVKFTREQAERTIEAFDAQMTSMCELLEANVYTVELITAMTDSLVNAGEALAKSLEKAQNDSEETAKVVGNAKKKIGEAELKLSDQVSRILGQGK